MLKKIYLLVSVFFMAFAFAGCETFNSDENVRETDISEIPTPKLESLENPVIELKTNYGNIFIELYKDKAPKTVENFLKYVNSGLYDGVVFHRVIKDFMIQGGGLDVNLSMKKTLKPIKNEADNGLKNDRGTIAMARTKAPHSASNQFFINVKDNDFLNFKSKTADGYGYCVFGKVVYGMKVVDDIQKVPVTIRKGYYNVPLRDVIIKKALQLR
ncbi:peptidylprolyl isomerase [Lentisphaerota bacterium WC36G]